MEPLSENYTHLDEGFFAKVKKGVHNTGTWAQNTVIDTQIKLKKRELEKLLRSHNDEDSAKIEKLTREIRELEGQKQEYMKAMIDIIEQLHHRILSLELKMQGAQHTN